MNVREFFRLGRELEEKGVPVIDLSIGNPERLQIPTEYWQEKIKVMEEDIDFPNLTKKNAEGYPLTAGHPETRQRVVNDISDTLELNLSTDDVIITPGATAGLYTVLSSAYRLTKEDGLFGKDVIVFAPYFPLYLTQLELNYLNPRIIDKKNFEIDLDVLKNAIDDKVVGIILTNPDSPTGKVFTREEMKGIAELLKSLGREDIFILEDAPYSQIVFDGSFNSIMPHYKNSFHVNSVSKNLIVPGERFGHTVIHPENPIDRSKMLDSFKAIYCNTNSTIMKVITKVGVNHQPYLELFKRNVSVMAEKLRQHGFEVKDPQSTFYVFAKLPCSQEEFRKKALCEEHLLYVPGSAFGKNYSDYVRFSLCCPADYVDRALAKLDRMFL